MKMKVLLMYAVDYSIADETTPGRLTEGCTLQYYFFGDNGEALKTRFGTESGALGYQRAKCSCDKDIRKKIGQLPAIFDASFEMNVGSDGKAVQKIVDLENPVAVDFSKLIAPIPTPKAAASATSAAK